jgi:glycosyltransferase involved in cell wall biosynthesis
MRAYMKIKELMPETRFDVVHDNQTLSYPLLFLKGLGLPLVATIHHPLSVDLRNSVLQARSIYEMARRYLWFPWVMQEFTARRMDRIITVSENTTRAVERMFHVPRELMTCVYNGIDTDWFRPLPGVEKRRTISSTPTRRTGTRAPSFVFDALRILKSRASRSI